MNVAVNCWVGNLAKTSMDYIEKAINHWIDNNPISSLDLLPWMNLRLKEEEIQFWIENDIIDNHLNRTTKSIKQRIVFLDVDGVLNHSKSKDAIDSICLENLRYIVKKTGAIIILVSSWKCGWFKDDKSRQDDDANYLDKRLDEVGLNIFDKSSRYASGRFLEVVDWVMRFNTTSFVILDDDYGHYTGTPLECFCVKTNYYNGGLTKELADIAIEKLLN